MEMPKVGEKIRINVDYIAGTPLRQGEILTVLEQNGNTVNATTSTAIWSFHQQHFIDKGVESLSRPGSITYTNFNKPEEIKIINSEWKGSKTLPFDSDFDDYEVWNLK